MCVYACVGSLWVLWLPPAFRKNMHVRLTGDFKLTVGVSVYGCISFWDPVMEW